MSDWKQRKYGKGTEVYVFPCNTKGQKRENGIMLTAYDMDSENNVMPEIKLESGKKIKGCQCWWIPKAEAEDGK